MEVFILDDKKRKITLSAIQVFQEKGIEKATVSDIVKGAGIAQGTFYLYFPSKLSVMPAIAEVMIEKTLKSYKQHMDVTAPFKTKLKQMIDIVFNYTKLYRDTYALIYVGMGSNRQLNEWEAIYEPYYHYIQMMLEKAIQNNEIRPELHPKRTAILLIGLFESAAEQSYLYDEQSDNIIEDKKQEVLDFALHALVPH